MYQPAPKDKRLPVIMLPKVLYLPRTCGKTTKLREESYYTGHTLVVATEYIARMLKNEAEAARMPIPEPITYTEFFRHEWLGRRITGFLIDDADQLLKHIAGATPIVTITICNQNDH